MRRYDIIIRINLVDDKPQPPRAIVKYRDSTGKLYRLHSGKPKESFESATMEAIKKLYEHIQKGQV